MRVITVIGVIVLAVAALVLAGCTEPPLSASGLNAAYERALARTRNAATFEGAAEAEVIGRLEHYFADMTPDSVVRTTKTIYAVDAVLYDNLAVVEGADAITAYFRKAAGEADSLKIEFQQVSRADYDYYIRWRMLIGSEALSPDAPLVSYGVTQFRFDEQGRVILHRDFWDAASGLYEHLPWVGALVAWLRGTLGAFDATVADNQSTDE